MKDRLRALRRLEFVFAIGGAVALGILAPLTAAADDASAQTIATDPISGDFTIWGFSAGFGPPTHLNLYDTSGTIVKSFTGAEPGGYCLAPSPVRLCNGRGVAVVHKQLWVSVLAGFEGTLVIKQVDTTTGAVVATIPDPCGAGGTGAMSESAADNLLLACYNNGLPAADDLVFLIDTAGTVLASCGLGPGAGNDTIAERAGTFLTDNGEFFSRVLTQYNLPTTIGGACAPTGTTFTVPPFGGVRHFGGVTGIAYAHGSPRLLASAITQINDFGRPPYSMVEGSFATGDANLIEGIAVND